MADRSIPPAPASRRGGRGAARKLTDARDAERAMLPVLAAIEARWLLAEAGAIRDVERYAEHQGIDPDLELAVLAAAGRVIYLELDDDEAGNET